MSTFASGVASGDVTTSSVVIWTRLHADAAELDVDWVVRSDDGATVRSGTAVARADDDHTVHVDVDGLMSGTSYEFTFTARGDVVVGRTRTLPDVADRFRFAVVCCSRWGWPGFELFDSVADEQPDLVLHLGDSIYEVGEIPPQGGSTDPPWECVSLDDYRRRYRQHRSHAGLRRLSSSVPMIAVWDDHEVVDNAPDPGSAERRRAGQQAWAEWMPSRRTRDPRPLDRYHSIGGVLDLALVDSRFAGRAPAEIDGPGEEDAAPGSLLGGAQWNRLESFAASSSATWFVLANQVQVGPMTLAARPALARPPWKRIVNPDQWDGYLDDRDRLYELLGHVAGRPVVLSGDLHSSWHRRLEVGAGREAVEFTCPSVSGKTYSDALREVIPLPTRFYHWWLTTLNGGIDHLDLDAHGYLVCDVTPERFTTTFVLLDGTRRAVTLDRAEGGAGTLAGTRDVAQPG